MSSNLNDPQHPWTRLTAAARTVRDDRDTTTPYGFSTRVAALAFVQEGKVSSLFDLFALRALGVACLLALFSFALNYQALTTSSVTPAGDIVADNEITLPTADDAVAVVLDLAD